MRILITGASGQLARAVREVWTGHDLICPNEGQLDLADRDSILRGVMETRPQAVLNLGAFTQVDSCEDAEDQATLINGTAVGWLAEACEPFGAVLVQISTDYVFDGRSRRPYMEDDPTNPVSAYGRSKLSGEKEARKASQHLIARTSWLYDAWGHNFYNTMLDRAKTGQPLRVVDDQRGAPTTCRALARQLLVALEENWRGTVHMTCAGETTWFEFAKEIFRRKHPHANLSPCSTVDFPARALRPAYSVLSGDRRAQLGTNVMPSWQDALDEIVAATRPNPLPHLT